MFHMVGVPLVAARRWWFEYGTGMSRFQHDQSFNLASRHTAAPVRACFRAAFCAAFCALFHALPHLRLQHARAGIPASAACARISEHLARLG